MGSGHILVYAFDVLVQIYKRAGFSERDAAQSILENNLYGLDIDDRAAQLAYFAVMMKAREYDRRIFSRDIQPHVYAIVESNGLDRCSVGYFTNNDPQLKKDFGALVNELRDAKEYGSILNISQVDFAALNVRIDEVRDDISIFRDVVLSGYLPLIQMAEVMAQKYDVVVTNPPYMGASGMSVALQDFTKQFYPNSKGDLFAVFIEKCMKMVTPNGLIAMITQHQWMFLAGYEILRRAVNQKQTVSLAHLGIGTFEDLNSKVVQSVSFIIRNTNAEGYIGCYHRLFEKQGAQENNEAKASWLINGKHCYRIAQNLFDEIDGSPIAYWASHAVIKNFLSKRVRDYADARQGLITGDNDMYMRFWYEPSISRVSFFTNNCDDTETNEIRWYPYAKGGGFRRWYGFNEYVVDWQNNGFALRNFKDEKGKLRSRPQNIDTYFKKGLTWSALTTYKLSLRTMEHSIYGGGGAAMFVKEGYEIYVLGFMNSCVAQYYLNLINPTINFLINDILSLPVVVDYKAEIENIVLENVRLSKEEYDSFEISHDFKVSPLINFAEQDTTSSIEAVYIMWSKTCEDRIASLRLNEKRMNNLFVEIYGLTGDISPEMEDKEIVLHRPDLKADIVALISYAVGCMFGRYSLDEPGLAYAGGEWDVSKYSTIIPDKDNIIPVCDDEYFDDDITGCFVKWVEVVFGKETLEENLKYIADALGGKSTPREVIRSYFLNDFYTDHLKTYQKRPIYWLFDSGKKNGFKALIYMHRYQRDLLARMRTDYVHEQQERYRTQLKHIEDAMGTASASERVKLAKQQKKLQDQALELQKYEEKIHHLADMNIEIDLDDGVKHNYELFSDVLAKIK